MCLYVCLSVQGVKANDQYEAVGTCTVMNSRSHLMLQTICFSATNPCVRHRHTRTVSKHTEDNTLVQPTGH